jgi:hypothetical protein
MFPEANWTTQIAQIPASTTVTTIRGSALRFLDLLRNRVTGVRQLSTPLPPNDPSSAELAERNIMEGLALEVYMDHHEEPWVVAPERLFRNASVPTEE